MASKKGPLTSDDYIDAAVKFVDERGLSSMTMRALGDEMGVDATALYRHFPNKESLIDAMIDWMLGEALALSEANNNHGPRERIVHQAKALRKTFERYPDIGLALMYSEGASINGYLYSKRGVDSLIEMGLSGEDLVRGYQCIESYIMGSCVHDFAGSPHNMDIRRTRYRHFEIPDFDNYSRTSSTVRKITEEGFDLGLNAILDVLEKSTTSKTRKL